MMNELTVFQFEGARDVRTLERDGEPRFVAKDVCDVLGIANARDAIADFPDDEILNVASSDVQDSRGAWGGASSFNIVNEPGLYRLIFQSRKPEAEAFKRWVFHEVLPTIRKTGEYALTHRCMPVMREVRLEREWRLQLVALTKAYRAGAVSRDDIRSKLGFPPELTTSQAKKDYKRLTQQESI
jgi:prophage antirepressor-like protein